jgi:hypothetical protein
MKTSLSLAGIGIAVFLCLVSLADTPPPPGGLYPLLPIAEGRWQVFAVPRPWLRAHWHGPAINSLYITLSSPTSKAIEDDIGPCVAPAQLVAVVTREGHAATQIPLESYDFCSPRKAHTHADWPSGPQSYVEGVAVHLAADGHLQIEQAFGRHLDEPYPIDRSPATFPRPSTGTSVKSTRMVALEELYGGLE